MLEQVDRRSVRRSVVADILLPSAVVLLGSALLGGLTSFGQQHLPHWINSLSNSAGGWTIFAFLLVWLSRARLVLAAVLGIVSFLTLVEAYGVVTAWRGYFYARPFSSQWTLVGLVAGPVLGAAAALTRYGSPLCRCLGVAIPAAVLLGEGTWALGAITETTSPVYWTLEIALSVSIMGVVIARTRPGLRSAALAVVVWLLGAAAFYGVIVFAFG